MAAITCDAESFDRQYFLDLLDRLYGDHIEPWQNNKNAGYEIVQAIAAIGERLSLAISRYECGMLAIFAEGGAFATVEVIFYRDAVGAAFTLKAGTVVTTSSGDLRFYLAQDIEFSYSDLEISGTVIAVAYGYEWNVLGQDESAGGETLEGEIDTIYSLVTEPAFTEPELQVRQESAAAGGRFPCLDIVGDERGIYRRDGEDDDLYRYRIRTVPDTVSPDAIVRFVDTIFKPYGLPYQFTELWSVEYQTCWDAPSPNSGVPFYDNGVPPINPDYDDTIFVFDDCRNPDPFRNRWLDERESRGAFVIVVNRDLTLQDVGLAYDDPATTPEQLRPAGGPIVGLPWRGTPAYDANTQNETPDLDDATFDNDSGDRLIVLSGANDPVQGPFDVDVLGTILYQGYLYAQIELYLENEFTYSDVFRTAISDWGNTQLDVTDNAAIAPDGTLTADKIIPNTSDIAHYIAQSITPDGSSQYTQSIFVKAAGYNRIRLWANTAGFTTDFQSDFDLITGERYDGDCDAFSIDYVIDGWYRVRTTGTSDSASSSSIRFFPLDDDGESVFPGDGTKGLYIWRANFTATSYLASPIYSGATPGTKGEDHLVFDDIPWWIRTEKHIVRYIPYAASTDTRGHQYLYTIYDDVTSYQVQLRWTNNDTFTILWYNGSWNAINTAAAVLDRAQAIILILNPTAGTIELRGATSGNGVYTGDSWMGVAKSITGKMYISDRFQTTFPDGLVTLPQRFESSPIDSEFVYSAAYDGYDHVRAALYSALYFVLQKIKAGGVAALLESFGS